MIDKKIQEIQEIYNKLRQTPKEPEARHKYIAETVGDAEVFIEKLLVWLRQMRNKYENNLP